MTRKLREYLAFLLACTMMVYACPVYGAAGGHNSAAETSGEVFFYEEPADFVPGEVIVCVAGGAEALAEDMAAAETAEAGLLGDAGTGVSEAAEAVSLFTCSLSAGEYARETGEVFAEEATELLLGAGLSEEATSEILLLSCEEGKERETIAMLEGLPHVEFAEPNRISEFSDLGDSSRFITSPSAWKQQWAYNGESAYGMGEEGIPLWEDARTNAPVNPETTGYDEDQIVVALMDSGVDYNNPEIRPVLWNCPEELQQTLGCGEFGWDAVAASTGEGDPTDPFDDLVGHGTHCAGIIGASWKDAGIYGIANNVKIMAITIGRDSIKESDALAAFDFVKRAMEAGVNVVACSNSWGGNYHGYAVERASVELGKLGALTVFSAGNESVNTDYAADTVSAVAANPYFLSVSSHNAEGELSSFSNYGLRTTHISAPGENISSAAAAVLGSIIPADTEAYVPYPDAATGKLYTAPVENMTIASPSIYVAEENAFVFAGARLATASTAEVGAREEDNTYLVSGSVVPKTEPPYVDLFVDVSDADFSVADGLFFGFRLTAAGWIPGLQYPDRMQLDVTAVHADGTENTLFNRTYVVFQGKPVDVSMRADTEAEYYRIRLYMVRYMAEYRSYVYIDPRFAAFDDFLFTEKCSAYVSMNGTSMACPAVSGEAAVLAAKFARLPSETRAKELQARILGSVVPFKNEEDRDKNRAGGYANLVKAVEEDYAPVIQGASFDQETGLLTLSGYFFPDAERAAAEGWSVLLDDTRITNVTWGADGRTAVLSMGSADVGTKEYAIRMMAYGSEKSGRIFLTIDTGKQAEGLMERIDLGDTPEDMLTGKNCGMIALSGKLYLLMSFVDKDESREGFVIWSWDTKKGGAWKRVNDATITPSSLGIPGAEAVRASRLMAYQGKLAFAAEYKGKGSEAYVTYLVTVDPETGTAASVTVPSKVGHAAAMTLAVVAQKESLVLLRSAADENTGMMMTELSLYAATENGALSEKVRHELENTIFLGDLHYQEDGTFLSDSRMQGPGGMEAGLFRWTVTEETLSHELLTDKSFYYTGEVLDPDSQSSAYYSAPVKDGMISTGLLNTAGNDTYVLKGLSAEGEISAVPVSAGQTKLMNFSVAASNGMYYVLGQIANGGTARMVFARLDLSTLGLTTIKDPGDVEKPDPPRPTPTPSGGGGGTVKTSSVTFSEFWVQVGQTWYVKDRSGQFVVNAWLCDDAVKANGRNVWYLLKADGTMASDGLLMDGTGNYYSLETEHKGYFGSLRYKDGYYDVAGKQVYLKFCQDHNGAFGAVLNPDGIEALKAAYGVVHYTNGNESIRSTSQF